MGTLIVVASATITAKNTDIPKSLIPRAAAMLGQDRREQQRTVRDHDRDDAQQAERYDRQYLRRTHAEDLPEQQREHLGGILVAEAQEQRAEHRA